MALGDFTPLLRRAFARYEHALQTDDVDELDTLFANRVDTIRSAGSQTLVGHDAIAAFRAQRGGAPLRRLVRVHVRKPDADTAIIVAESVRSDGNSGLQ